MAVVVVLVLGFPSSAAGHKGIECFNMHRLHNGCGKTGNSAAGLGSE